MSEFNDILAKALEEQKRTDYITNVKAICEAYLDIQKSCGVGYGFHAYDIIKSCEKLEVMGWEWGHRLEYPHFCIRQGYYLTNKGTAHESNPSEWYVVWDNGNVGRLQFVTYGYNVYETIEDEWNEFRAKLMSYDPLNYDPLNCCIVYNIENGKRILEDYNDICNATLEKIRKKIAFKELEDARKRVEKLEADMRGEEDEMQ